jgi:AcrR family transcriptional regulator
MVYRETDRIKERKAQVRDNIIKAAQYLVSTQGFRAASISAVAKEADIATGTVYKHFPSKADLLCEIFRSATEREVQKVAQSIDIEGTVPQRLQAAIICFAQRAILGRTLAWALIAEPVDPLVEAERLIYRQTYADIFERLLREGISKGEIPQQSASVSAAAIVGVISETLVGPLAPSRRDAHDVVTPSTLNETLLIDSICRFCLQAVCGNWQPS